ncbi:ankyrin, partial [Fusarium pseudoanthophilum]
DLFNAYKRSSAFPYKYLPDDEAVRECFRLIIDAGAHVNHADNFRNTPLHLVEIPLVAQLLLETGADITAINWCNNMPLHTAQNLDVMKMILNKVDIGNRDRESKKMFFRLLEGSGTRRDRGFRSFQGALQLLDLGVDARAVDNKGSTALHYLASTEEGIASPEGL